MALSHDPLWPRAGGWPAFESTADAVVLGVPTWRTSLSPTGAHATPAAVREALARYGTALMGPPVSDLTSVLQIADAGDVDEPDGDAGEAAVIARVRDLTHRTDLVIALGGDNSLTYPVALGAEATGLITFDAHFDLRDGISNGTPVRRLVEDVPAASELDTARIDPTCIVQIGIADFANSAAYAQRAADWGIRVITLDELRRRGVDDVVAEALEIAGAGPSPRVHLDIDVDVCDRSVVPGCPASVPGGLAAWELRALARAVASDPRVVTADLAEVDATADTEDGRTVRLAALCVLELLTGLSRRGNRP
ncbi:MULTISPECIES: arginase family protein [unclassified Microbacterium]|uniref:arginase family protein n=1 Tax=unclassified Microbacterium TaxID=2609290 RepID=UPI000EA8D6B7|nr:MULTISPECIES: arginase family protein [unclassified Microbacterium]MBT2486921.1 arginase family protein [Microbacterium sp. ISL-108]RKN64835.1 formimidoylglutamase [Microbacterium sp. CGR2]